MTELPPGYVDEPDGSAPLDYPIARVRGWAWPFPDDRVSSVDVLVDGEPVARARLQLRGDIAEALDRPEAMLGAWEALVDVRGLAPGEVALEARATALGGEQALIPGRAVVVPEARPDAGGIPAPDTDELLIERPAARNRAWARARFGYDPGHAVVLVDGGDAALAVAALDVLRDERPALELIVPDPGSGLAAELLGVYVRTRSLEDRVYVPPPGIPRADLTAAADAVLAASPHDLAALCGAFAELAPGG